MLIGAMNHPGLDVIDEIKWMAGMKLDFIDLTVEPPRAASWQVDRQAVRSALERFRLQVVGHTAYYLPFASPFEPLRKVAVDECCRCLELFADVGARWMNIHPDNKSPLHPRQYYIDRNIESLSELLDHARKIGIGLMVENIPGHIFNSVEDLGALLDALPGLGAAPRHRPLQPFDHSPQRRPDPRRVRRPPPACAPARQPGRNRRPSPPARNRQHRCVRLRSRPEALRLRRHDHARGVLSRTPLPRAQPRYPPGRLGAGELKKPEAEPGGREHGFRVPQKSSVFMSQWTWGSSSFLPD